MITETLLSRITQLDIFSKSPDILVPCLHIWCVLSCVDMYLQCVLKFDKKRRNATGSQMFPNAKLNNFSIVYVPKL